MSRLLTVFTLLVHSVCISFVYTTAAGICFEKFLYSYYNAMVQNERSSLDCFFELNLEPNVNRVS